MAQTKIKPRRDHSATLRALVAKPKRVLPLHVELDGEPGFIIELPTKGSRLELPKAANS